MPFDYKKISEYYDDDYWNAPGKKSGYTNMLSSIGGDWHRQACSWFNSVIPVKGKHLFDAGCGLGHFMVAFKELGAHVFGCDCSDYSAQIVGSRFGAAFFHCAIEKLGSELDNFFDIIFCSATLEHIPVDLVDPALENLLKITKPGGLVYLEVDTKPNKLRDMIEESHVNIRPWAVWLIAFTASHYIWEPACEETTELSRRTDFPGFPHPDWNFFVFRKWPQ